MLYDDGRYEEYEELFNPLRDRQARKLRKPDVNPKDRVKARRVIQGDVSDLEALEGDFNISYKPSKYESGWLLDSLREFIDQKLITDVLALVRGGKEATVYRCAGHPSTGEIYLAVKVYRPIKFRALSNDAMYKEGRGVLAATGYEFGKEKERIERAMDKKSAFGRQLAHTSWLMHEFKALRDMSEVGAAVPKPIASGENAILMSFIGDDNQPAPALGGVSLADGEAKLLFDEVMRNVMILLSRGWIHGDLSAYNILYLDGKITLIDFPQVVAVAGNRQAKGILARDVERICDYFATQGLDRDPDEITEQLWRQYRPRSEREMKADESRHTEDGYELD